MEAANRPITIISMTGDTDENGQPGVPHHDDAAQTVTPNTAHTTANTHAATPVTDSVTASTQIGSHSQLNSIGLEFVPSLFTITSSTPSSSSPTLEEIMTESLSRAPVPWPRPPPTVAREQTAAPTDSSHSTGLPQCTADAVKPRMPLKHQEGMCWSMH